MNNETKFENFIFKGEYCEYDVKVESPSFTYTPPFVSSINKSWDESEYSYITFGNEMEIRIDFETAVFEYPTEKDCIIKYNDSIISIHKN